MSWSALKKICSFRPWLSYVVFTFWSLNAFHQWPHFCHNQMLVVLYHRGGSKVRKRCVVVRKRERKRNEAEKQGQIERKMHRKSFFFFRRVYNIGTNYNYKIQLVKKYPFGSFGGEGMDLTTECNRYEKALNQVVSCCVPGILRRGRDYERETQRYGYWSSPVFIPSPNSHWVRRKEENLISQHSKSELCSIYTKGQKAFHPRRAYRYIMVY